MIFDIEINEPDQPSFKNTPKKLYSYIKSQKILVGYLPKVILICCQCFLLEYAYG
jgi:hypothetical protein